MSHKTHGNGGGESYSGVVLTKQPNEGEGGPKEVVEGRLLARENADQLNPNRTQSRESGPNGLERVREAAKKDGSYSSPHCCTMWTGRHGKNMDKTLKSTCKTFTDESIAGHIKRNHHEESGYPKRMEGNDHRESRRWKTKSRSTRWGRPSTRSGKRISWVLVRKKVNWVIDLDIRSHGVFLNPVFRSISVPSYCVILAGTSGMLKTRSGEQEFRCGSRTVPFDHTRQRGPFSPWYIVRWTKASAPSRRRRVICIDECRGEARRPGTGSEICQSSAVEHLTRPALGPTAS
jgi:hypothetical protein